MSRKSLATFVLLVVVAIVPAAQAQDALTDTTFFISYIPNIQFAPLYVGLAKGYFTDAGFNLDTEYGDETLGVDLIAADQRQFGFISGEQVIAARANERPIVFVYEWFQKYPVGVVVTDKSGITSAADLAGHHVGIPGRFGASYSGLTALLAANGMTESDIQLEEIGFNAPEVVCVGGVEASVVYVNNEPLQIQERIANDDCGSVTGITVFPVSDAVDMVSNGIVISESLLGEHPEQVAAMNLAFDRALRDTINNPAQAYLLSADYVENLPLTDDLRAALATAAGEQDAYLADNPDADRAAAAERRAALLETLSADFPSADLLQLRVLLSSIDLWDADTLGYSDPASWEATQNVLIEMGFVDEPINLDAAFTNNYLPD